MVKSKTKIVSILGPKGGVGRSSVAVDLARVLGQRDFRVLLVDTEPYKQGLAILLEMPHQSVQSAKEFTAVATPLPRVDLLLISPEEGEIAASFEAIRGCEHYDLVIVDMAASMGLREAEGMVACDLPILVSNAEPAALFAATQCLRLCAVHALRRTESLHNILPYIDPLKDSWDFMRIYQALPQNLQMDFAKALANFRIGFVLNQRRESSEIQQCEALCHAWGMFLGIAPEFVGSLGHEEKRWFFARRIAPSSQFPREEGVLSDLGLIASKILSLLSTQSEEKPCLATLDVEAQSREFLLLSGTEDPRISYRRLWEGYRRENGLVSAVLDQGSVARIVQLLETALRNATRAEEDSLGVTAPKLKAVTETELETSPQRRLSASFPAVQPWSAQDCPAGASQILVRGREAQSLSIQELALRTRIPKRVLESIERCEFADIDPKYLRAYLVELANYFSLDENEVLGAFGFVRL